MQKPPCGWACRNSVAKRAIPFVVTQICTPLGFNSLTAACENVSRCDVTSSRTGPSLPLRGRVKMQICTPCTNVYCQNVCNLENSRAGTTWSVVNWRCRFAHHAYYIAWQCCCGSSCVLQTSIGPEVRISFCAKKGKVAEKTATAAECTTAAHVFASCGSAKNCVKVVEERKKELADFFFPLFTTKKKILALSQRRNCG